MITNEKETDIKSLSREDLETLYKDLYKRAKHTVLSLQDTDSEHSVGFISLKEFFEKTDGVTDCMRDWTQFKAKEINPEYMCPYIFFTLLLKTIDLNFIVKEIVNLDQVTGNKQENKFFGHEYIEQFVEEDAYYGLIYIPIGNDKYIKLNFF